MCPEGSERPETNPAPRGERDAGENDSKSRELRRANYWKYPVTSTVSWRVPVGWIATTLNVPSASSAMMALLALVWPAT